MIYGGINTNMSEEFVRQLSEWSEQIETKDYATDIESPGNGGFEVPKPIAAPMDGDFTDYRMDFDSLVFSGIYDKPKFEGDNFFYNDKLLNGVLLFKTDGDMLRLRTMIEADSAERDRFITVPDSLVTRVKKNGVYYMPLGVSMIDDRHIGVSYSLPNIFIDNRPDIPGIAVGYSNKSAIIVRDVDTLEPAPMYVPKFMIWEDGDFFDMHFWYTVFKGDVIYSCMKHTWPMEYGREVYENDINRNSFDPRFYATDSPWLAAYSLSDGRLSKHFAQLEPCAAKSLTGYWFNSAATYSDGNEPAYSDGYSGTIHVTDDIHSGSSRQYSAFCVDTASFPTSDSTMFYSREYARTYDRFYYRCITTVRMDGDNIYCLVRYSAPKSANAKENDAEYTFVTIDRQTGHATERRIPRFDGMEALGYGLRTAGGHVSPFVFSRSSAGLLVRVFGQSGNVRPQQTGNL